MLKVRSYGSSGPGVIVVHGGPGACGSMAQVARGISDSFRVLEPFQSSIGTTVADHVADLHRVVESCGDGAAPALVGHSWGAMLSLAYAATYPKVVGPIVLVCSGTFDRQSRERFGANMEKRMDADMRRRLDRLKQLPDPNERFRLLGDFTMQLYSYDLATTDQEIDESEPGANSETWEDMVRLQGEGVYPTAFAAIKSPVLMLHGAADPHPGGMIRASLEPILPQLEYREWERCGHYPWLETATRDEFFSVLRKWLADRFGERTGI